MKADSGIAGEGGYISPPEFFKRLKPDADGLERFGFAKKGSAWEYSAKVAGGALVCRIAVDGRGGVVESVADAATGDEYVQHRIAGASGRFVGRVRQDVMNLMARIANECFSRDVFKTDAARDLISFAGREWGEKPEFLWKQFPDYAVLRRRDTDKWYALVARLTADKVGGDKKDTVEIVNLRRTEGMDASRFLPAYHMNKKTWATVAVDDAAKADELRRFLVVSRENAV